MSTVIPIAKASSISYPELVQSDKVHTSLYTDPAIFEEEMDKVFYSSWIWIGHVSEVPEPGSFKSAWIGRQPVVLVRDRKKELHVLLNRCRHRGATVCEHKSGKTASFVCPYHGWGYGLDGSLRGVPSPESYGDTLDKSQLGLESLRVEQYAGMVFATFKREIMPLSDWLGPARKWMDLFMKQAGGYPVKVAGTHRFTFPGNWKIQLENTTDAYHFPIVHKSFVSGLDEQAKKTFDFLNSPGFVEDLGNGHSVAVMIPELVDMEADLDRPIPARFEELAQTLRDEGHDEEKVRRIVRAVGGTGFNLNLYPNVACSMAFFRVLRPIAVDKTEVHHVALIMDGGPTAANQMRLRLHEHFQGPLGFGTPDDGEAWQRVQKGANAGRDLWILVNRGLPGEVRTEDGLKSDVSAETGMRAAYRQWLKSMTAAA